MYPSLNVLGTPLKPCSSDPLTGWFRDGCCNTDADDRGSHTVCAVVSDDFLRCLAVQGNDLITPSLPHFPGLQPGDRWCVCAASWLHASEQGRACPVDLERTHQAALELIQLDLLLRHAITEAGHS